MHTPLSRRLLPILLTLGPPAGAATLVVDNSSDLTLSACVTGIPGDCSLRGAITAANAQSDHDTIEFNIPQSDPGFQVATQHWRISVGSPVLLPAITQPVLIDGFSQPGALTNSNSPALGGLNGILKIEIRGANPAGNANYALQLDSAESSTVRGLVINNYLDGQVFVRGAGAHRIEGCYLGTDITGNAAQLLSNGIVIAGNGPYVIGGLQPAQRNLLSGLNNALLTTQQAANGVRIEGNLFGTNAAGDSVIGNEFGVLLFRMTNSVIGGTDPAARNLFSGHRSRAIILQVNNVGVFSGLRIEGNYFGTDVSGQKILGNDLNGLRATIELNGGGAACEVSIGGSGVGQANLIAYSAGAGIRNDRCLGLPNTLNRYRGNASIGLDNVLGGGNSGLGVNDAGDADEGGNRLQNYPEITLPTSGNIANLQYRVDSAVANATYPITVNFYRGGCGGGSDALLASDTIAIAQAQQTIAFTVNPADGGGILPLTATAVDAAGNASEFAPMQGDEVFRSDFEDALAPLRPGRCR